MKNVKFKIQPCVVIEGTSYRSATGAAGEMARCITSVLEHRVTKKLGYAAYHSGWNWNDHYDRAYRRVLPIMNRIFAKG